MGLCTSSAGETAESPRRATALVLLPTGELREYPRHATAAQELDDAAAAAGGDAEGPSAWFLCDADGMGFEGAVPAVSGDEALRPGQIYFALPAGARRRGLRREEVAALAVRASAALATRAASSSSSGRRKRRAVAPLLFSPPPEEEEEEACSFACAHGKTVPAAGAGKRRVAQHRRFASDLSAIPELEIISE